MKTILKFLTSIAVVMCMIAVPVSATELTDAGGTSSSSVELTNKAATFSVTVPTVLPVNVSEMGEIIVADDNKIVNNSAGPVVVESVEFFSLNGWKLVDFDTDFSSKKVGLKEYGFQLNGENISTEGKCSADGFGIIAKGSELPFSYDVNVAVQNKALENEQMAKVVFTIGWYEVGSYEDVFANNSWSDIITACQDNTVPDTWNVGDSKTMLIDGVEYAIAIIGKNHDVYSDGSGTAPLTFQMRDHYPAKYVINSSDWNGTSWEGSQLRTRMAEIESLMPEEIRNAIKEVDKLTVVGNRNTTLITTSDRLFVLSGAECGQLGGFANKNEGTKYAYYEAGNSAGTGDWQWTRSPNVNTSDAWVSISADGYGYSDMATWSRVVAPAFCF